MNSKAQISLFIIIGIVILLGVSVYFIYSNVTDTQSDELELTETIPQEFAVVQKYVSECVRTVARDGLRLIGAQGGYINPSSQGLSASRNDPTESDGVYLSSLSESFVPYWWFLASSNDCDGDCFYYSNYPPLEGTSDSVKNQLEDYINAELLNCVGDFSSLRESGYQIEYASSVQTQIYFRDDDIRFFVEFPITASTSDTEQFISQFEYIANVPFLRMYEYATLLLDVQIENNYVENVILHTISAYTGTDTNSLPPFFAATTNPVETASWITVAVREQINDLLLRHINGIQVLNSANYAAPQFAEGSILDELTKIQTLPLQTDDPYYQNRYSSFESNFRYQPNWRFFFQLNNGQQVIQPSTLSLSFLPFMAINEFRTNYDLSVPFTISIYDPNAFEGSGYTFMFASEANIRNNMPLSENFQRDFTLLDLIEESEFSQNETTNYCKPNQRNSGIINATIIDRKTQQPVSDVLVTTSCAIESCTIASTGENGIISDKFPICLGGLLQLHNLDYAPYYQEFSTTLNESQNLGVIELEPLQSVEVEVVKRQMLPNLPSFEWSLSNSLQSLTQYETAVITLTQVNVQDTMDPHTATITVTGQDTINTIRNISLVPGVYEVEGQVYSIEPLLIPSREHCYRKVPEVWDKECIEIPEIELENLITSQVEFGANTQYWRLDATQLDSASKITIVTSGYDLYEIPEDKRKVEQLEFMNQTTELFVEYANRLQPIIT